MNQPFNYTFDRMRENNPAQQADNMEEATQAKDDHYASGSNTRNVCFVPMDGNPVFLNYGYLIRGQYFKEDSKIVLTFTSDTITLIGVRLESLFYDFMHHLPKQVVCRDERYNNVDDGACVNAVQIDNK